MRQKEATRSMNRTIDDIELTEFLSTQIRGERLGTAAVQDSFSRQTAKTVRFCSWTHASRHRLATIGKRREA